MKREGKETQVITICTHKGGAGKTTCAAALGHSLSLKGYSVLNIDSDAQGNMSSRLGYPENKNDCSFYSAIKNYFAETSIHPTEFISKTAYENFDIMTGDTRLSSMKGELVTATCSLQFVYKEIVDKIKETKKYDFIIFDTAPNIKEELTQALMASNWLILPIDTGIDSFKGMNDTLKSYIHIKKGGNNSLKIAGILFNKVNINTSVAKEVIPYMINAYKDDLFEVIIPVDELSKKAENSGMPITAYDITGRAAIEYLKLAEEVLKKLAKFTTKMPPMISTDATVEDVEAIGASIDFVRKAIDEEKKVSILDSVRKINTDNTIALNNSDTNSDRPSEEDLLNEITRYKPEIKMIPRSSLIYAPAEWNFFSKVPRYKFEEMTESIARYGLFQPIIVWEQPDKRYMILGGHTRETIYDELYQATEDKKWLTIQARIYPYSSLTDLEASEIVMDSNYAQRSQLNPSDRSKCYWAKSKIFKVRHGHGSGVDINSMIAKYYGVNRSTICFYKKLVNLIDGLGHLLTSGKITSVSAIRLANLPTEIQEWLRDNYLNELTSKKILLIEHNMTHEEIENILSNDLKEYKVTLNLHKKPIKGQEPIVFFVDQRKVEKVKNAFKILLDIPTISDDVKNIIADQLDI